MQSTETFNIHGITGFRLKTDGQWTKDYFAAEYGFASGDLSDDIPSVELRWRESAIPSSPGSGYRFRAHRALARWYYRIEFNQVGIRIDGAGNHASVAMVQHMLLHPALRWLSSLQGALMLHAAAVAHKDRSLLISGMGGAGKTTSSTSLLSGGDLAWGLQGDDYVVVGHDGKSYSYATRSHLYLDLVRRFPEIRKRLKAEEVRRLRINWALRRMSGDRIKLPVRVELDRLWPEHKVIEEAEPAALLLIRPSSKTESELSPVDDPRSFAEQLELINFTEARHFIKLIDQPQNWIEDWRRRERKLIEKMVSRRPCYELSLARGRVDLEPLVADLVNTAEPTL